MSAVAPSDAPPRVATGFLTYLGVAIRLELARPYLEHIAGSREKANEGIAEALRQFKEAREK